ncbi:energy-coupling factor transporter ATP-binding protein EcfA2 [Actinoplanes octamycinicus]|uniref:Energy-coupling factor transporter ATP-binding protein EcfA2 n=1 Tax=Actinoplanes octamycinicus TaxID=135948 RepID=A0A7W7H468_9ACTN|nr:AAA family ATPase [Actinoplanes octamycinicus]MBB4743668.1 energy-coupling factor transporter ATP-binding protein EcfA2 [Actinoplanes octamycinicus]GIE61094.1 chaperone [Actinoplanes octamycinicus]
MNPEHPTNPAWLREIDLALCAHPQILLTGNVRDLYRLPDPGFAGRVRFMGLVEALWSVAQPRGYGALLAYSTGVGVELISATPEGRTAAEQVLREADVEQRRPLHMAQVRDLITAVTDLDRRRAAGPPVALVLSDAARLFTGELLSPEERLFLATADRLAYRALPVGNGYNTVFWVLDREHDLPAWFATGNHTLRITGIPEPDLSARLATARDMAVKLPEMPEEESERQAVARRFAEASHGMRLRSMQDVVRLAAAAGIPGARIDDAVRAFRVGVPDNPWQSAGLRDRLRTAEKELGTRVLGQPDAVRRVLDILARSATGLSGAHTGNTSKPRGVLFFAGPTGVGKTELAKALAELLFGDENAYLRFDMSEFSAEHSEARLIGAPPGFIGHDAGGELTNGIRQQPFRVVLFDEIEKAHQRLLDKFLQILDDGRLTDGRGGTVYFTEALIVFTTNLGIVVPGEDNKPVENVTDEMELPEIEERVRQYIEVFFRHLIGRPELYNRVEQSIVVFDFLRPEAALEIADRTIGRVADAVRRNFGATLEFSDSAREELLQQATYNLRNGGRGIVATIESILLNPLARELFARPPVPGQALRVAAIEPQGQNYVLVME